MKKIACILFLAVGTNAFGQQAPKIAKSPAEFIPQGYVVFEEIQGDLNKDNKTDYIFIIKGTSKDEIIQDEYRGELDRNRRGIIIAFRKDESQYEVVLDRRDCFSSENEDGGVYFAPELGVSVNKGNLLISYHHGRYGYWTYNFRYQNSDFELIGYDNSQNQGPVVERFVSMNFMTKKMLIKDNTNQNAEGGDEKFKESWKDFSLKKPIKLADMSDFEGFSPVELIEINAGH